jgi:hypothetical protein
MIPHLFYYHLVVLGLLWLCVMLLSVWPSRCTVTQQRPAECIKESMEMLGLLPL